MSVKVFCKMADCVNWDNGLCGADEIRVDREGYCATYEEIPEDGADELDLPARGEDVNWEEEEEENLEVGELGTKEWSDLDEDEEEEDETGPEEDDWTN
jgi:hypothetical protein